MNLVSSPSWEISGKLLGFWGKKNAQNQRPSSPGTFSLDHQIQHEAENLIWSETKLVTLSGIGQTPCRVEKNAYIERVGFAKYFILQELKTHETLQKRTQGSCPSPSPRAASHSRSPRAGRQVTQPMSTEPTRLLFFSWKKVGTKKLMLSDSISFVTFKGRQTEATCWEMLPQWSNDRAAWRREDIFWVARAELRAGLVEAGSLCHCLLTRISMFSELFCMQHTHTKCNT